MKINGYTLITELKNDNSGFSKWGFAKKNGKQYFIKELISPTYPINQEIMSEKQYESQKNYCLTFEKKLKNFFYKINDASHGNLVRIEDFFRCGSKYYIVSEKIDDESYSIEFISSLTYELKILLLKSLARCFYDLHEAEIVHFDVKPSNIIVRRTANGKYTAKLIDFDSGFEKGTYFDDEIGGDLAYLAPETFIAICGENMVLDEKTDIFALGLVFHEFFCGRMPYYDKNKYEYPYEVLLDNGKLMIETSMMPEFIGKLITSMIDIDPRKRPYAGEILSALNGYDTDANEAQDKTESKEAFYDISKEERKNEDHIKEPSNDTENWFSVGGDL